MSTIGPIYGREFAGTFGRAARLVASASLSVLEAGAHWRSAPNSGHSQRPSSVCRPIDACAPISQIKCFGTVISALQQQPSLQQMSRPCASRRAGNELRHRGAPGMTGPFSIRCDRGAYYFLTFDTATNRMISETIGGSTYRGRIKTVSENEIQFVLLLGGQTPPDLYFMRKEGRVDVRKDSEWSVALEHRLPRPHEISSGRGIVGTEI
jgi:hypothetical protein